MEATEKGFTVIVTSTPTQIVRAVFKDTTVQIQRFELTADVELTYGDARILGTLLSGTDSAQLDQLIEADALHSLVYPNGIDGDGPRERTKRRYAKK